MSRKPSQISVIRSGQPSHTGVMLVQGIPTTTKSAFKAVCAKKGVTMRDCLIQLMRQFVERNQETIGPIIHEDAGAIKEPAH